MTKSLLIAGLLTTAALMIAQHNSSADSAPGERFTRVRERVAPRLTAELREIGCDLGAPAFIRVFKEERELELWLQPGKGKPFTLFRTYPIAAMSGTLGPKQREGDLQAPEGFYFVPKSGMNPMSTFHLSFNIGYPNAYDRSHGRDGTFLMVHGNKISTGCFAMTDPKIEEIYTIADAALTRGQSFFRVHCFPFRMTPARMAKADADGSEWVSFWKNLKTGYDWFESRGVPPDVVVAEGEYRFGEDG